ncbi:transmembrane and coiled-coil domains-containing protein 7 [Rhizophlyctis rosea]|nr:transmembrane and coiled-coil domains-containing protein 7 [Rhizophlyctis rosea]
MLRLADEDVRLSMLAEFSVARPHVCARAVSGPTGGVMFSRCSEGEHELQSPAFVGAFFLFLLEQRSAEGEEEEEDSTSSDRELLTTQLLLSMMERFGETIIKSPGHIISFVKSILLSDEEKKSLSLGLSLLQMVLEEESVTITTKDALALNEILVSLQALRSHVDEDVRSLAEDVRDLIKSRGTESSAKGEEQNQKEMMRKALEDVKDPLLPVRAQGMAVLRSLVLAKSPVATDSVDFIVDVLLDQLKEEDRKAAIAIP